MSASLHARVLTAAAVIVVVFLGATGLALERAFRDSAETAMRERLQSYVYALLAASEPDRGGRMRLPEKLHEQRFNQPGSGLYADVRGAEGGSLARTPSAVGIDLPPTPRPPPGERSVDTVALAQATPAMVLSFTVRWQEAGAAIYTFRVIETLAALDAQLARYRRSLWTWLAAAAVLLLAAQGVILRWGLAPLRRAATDLTAIEAGRAQRLTGDYPRELRGLTNNLNALLASSERQLKRYRDALGDLAHSLKTPLAIIHNELQGDASAEKLRAALKEPVNRIDEIVGYQLQRAATSGRRALTAPVDVGEKLKKILAALTKVHAAKALAQETALAPGAVFYGDGGDLLEVLGNLLDNAFKWARSRIRVTARNLADAEDAIPRLELCVEDDGPGIAREERARILARGARADPDTPGHGLGLAMVESIVGSYGGILDLGDSDLGGARVVLIF